MSNYFPKRNFPRTGLCLITLDNNKQNEMTIIEINIDVANSKNGLQFIEKSFSILVQSNKKKK